MKTIIETNFAETRGLIESILGMDWALKAKNDRINALEAEVAALLPLAMAARRFSDATSIPDGGEFADMCPTEIALAHDALHDACANFRGLTNSTPDSAADASATEPGAGGR